MMWNKEITWDDIIIPAVNLRSGVTAPAFTAYSGGIYSINFEAGKNQSVHGAFELLHSYKEGTDIQAHIHWTPEIENSGSVVWGLEYTITNMGSLFPSPSTQTVTVPCTGLGDKNVVSQICMIPGSTLRIGAICAFRLYRLGSGADNYTGRAYLQSFGIHFQQDTRGSRLMTSK